jgi:hypothetical protein
MVSWGYQKNLRRFEYDGSLVPATDFDPIALEEHQISPAIGLNLSAKREVNFGGGGVPPSAIISSPN